jgi:hypothetical protein
MEIETKMSRIKERLKALHAIRDDGEYSKTSKVLAPLEFGSLIEIKYDADKAIVGANLTKLGEEYLAFYSKKYK